MNWNIYRRALVGVAVGLLGLNECRTLEAATARVELRCLSVVVAKGFASSDGAS